MDTNEVKTSKTNSIKSFWVKNKTKIFVTTTAILALGVVIQKSAIGDYQKFLEENGLESDFLRYLLATEEEIAEFENTKK